MTFRINWSALSGGLVLASLAFVVAYNPGHIAGFIEEVGAKSTSVVVSYVATVMVFVFIIRAVWRGLTVRRHTVAYAQNAAGTAVLSRTLDIPEHALQQIANHEAAHAAVAIATGGTVLSAVVKPGTGEVNGRVESRSAGTAWEDVRFARMAISIAGHVADQRGNVDDEGAMSDLSTVNVSALSIIAMGRRPAGYPADVPLTVENLVEAARERAKDILTEHSDGAERIASLLVENKYRIVPGSKVHAAFDGTTGES